MSFLDRVITTENGPFFGTIAGDPGLGKSSMAAMFPKPLFLAVEDGVERIKADIRPESIRVKSVEDLRDLLKQIRSEEHEYQTLVIDSVTALETMFGEHIMKENPKASSLAQAAGGYGGGYLAVAALHNGVRKMCKAIRDERGMHIVFIAHADTEVVDLPDKDKYMRYSFRMDKRSVKHYIDDVNVVGFVRMELYVKGDSEQRVKKAIGTGERLFDCVPSACTVAKNCYQITEVLPYPEDTNPLGDYI